MIGPAILKSVQPGPIGDRISNEVLGLICGDLVYDMLLELTYFCTSGDICVGEIQPMTLNIHPVAHRGIKMSKYFNNFTCRGSTSENRLPIADQV